MNTSNKKFKDIDEYHNTFPTAIRHILDQLRQVIVQAAPHSMEVISYGMPAFKQNKVLIYYAVHKKHIGLYPTPSAIMHFKEQLSHYKTSKGAIQLAIEEPLPLSLIHDIVHFRVEEDAKNVR